MELLVKAAVLGIIAALLALLLKKTNPEIALMLTIAAGLVMIISASEILGSIRDFVTQAAQLSQISAAILSPVLKCVGISIISRIASDVCKDAGQASISGAIELVATILAIYVALPLMTTLLQMIGGFL